MFHYDRIALRLLWMCRCYGYWMRALTVYSSIYIIVIVCIQRTGPYQCMSLSVGDRMEIAFPGNFIYFQWTRFFFQFCANHFRLKNLIECFMATISSPSMSFVHLNSIELSTQNSMFPFVSVVVLVFVSVRQLVCACGCAQSSSLLFYVLFAFLSACTIAHKLLLFSYTSGVLSCSVYCVLHRSKCKHMHSRFVRLT